MSQPRPGTREVESQMQDKSSPKVRRTVLGLVLYEQPVAMTAAKLRREFGADAAAAIADLQAAAPLNLKAGLQGHSGLPCRVRCTT